MDLKDFGYNERVEKRRVESNLKHFDIGRVVAEHKQRYTVVTEKGEYDAEITGNLRFSARSREDFPAVGDWVALTIYDPDFSVIHAIIPRFSILSRQAVGQFGEVQDGAVLRVGKEKVVDVVNVVDVVGIIDVEEVPLGQLVKIS